LGLGRSMLIREQMIKINVKDIRITYERVAIAISKLGRLHLRVNRICTERRKPIMIEVCQSIQRQQHGDALAIGWVLINPGTRSVRDRNRLNEFRLEASEIIQCQVAVTGTG